MYKSSLERSKFSRDTQRPNTAQWLNATGGANTMLECVREFLGEIGRRKMRMRNCTKYDHRHNAIYARPQLTAVDCSLRLAGICDASRCAALLQGPLLAAACPAASASCTRCSIGISLRALLLLLSVLLL